LYWTLAILDFVLINEIRYHRRSRTIPKTTALEVLESFVNVVVTMDGSGGTPMEGEIGRDADAP
jgi:hypothetical protein